MKDYTKVCWSCGSEAMEAKGSYYQCQECGATYNPVPGVAPQEFTEEFIEGARFTGFRPTKSLIKRIKKRKGVK